MKYLQHGNHMKNNHGAGREAACRLADLLQDAECVHRGERYAKLWADVLSHSPQGAKKILPACIYARLSQNFFGSPQAPASMITFCRARTAQNFSNHRRMPQPFVFKHLPKSPNLLLQFLNSLLCTHVHYSTTKRKYFANVDKFPTASPH